VFFNILLNIFLVESLVGKKLFFVLANSRRERLLEFFDIEHFIKKRAKIKNNLFLAN